MFRKMFRKRPAARCGMITTVPLDSEARAMNTTQGAQPALQAATDARHIHREHQVQLRLIEAVEAPLAAGKDASEALAALVDYTRAHFLSEELLMRQYEYADYDDHILDHERMLDWLAELADGGRAPSSRRHALQELKALFLRHIGGRDRQLHEFLVTL
jgi:hemerythrin